MNRYQLDVLPTKYAIYVFSTAEGQKVDAWLESHDSEAHEGRGYTSFTTEGSKVMTFESMSAALEFYHQQSKTRPLRDDMLPNCPLTAYTVQILRIT